MNFNDNVRYTIIINTKSDTPIFLNIFKPLKELPIAVAVFISIII